MKLFKKTRRMVLNELNETHSISDLVGHTCHNAIIGFAYFSVGMFLLFICGGIILCMMHPTYKLLFTVLANIVVFFLHSMYNWNRRATVDGNIGTLCLPENKQ